MAFSAAFTDYQQRFRGLTALLRGALDAEDPLLATAAAKGAIVLAAAAAERFMNDALRQACQRMQVDRYDVLSESQQAYLCAQIARRIAGFDNEDGEVRSFAAERRAKLRSAIAECAEAFNNPATWTHIPDFGMFMDGTGAPDKINAVIRDFDPQRGSFLEALDRRSAGRAAFTRALTELVDARHNAAHAKPATDPSPSDARGWIVSSYWFTRAIDAHLCELVETGQSHGRAEVILV